MDAPLQTDSPAQARLHRGHHARRRHLIAQLLAHAVADEAEQPPTYSSPARRLASKIQNCGAMPTAYQDADTGQLIISRALCRSRVCPTCGAIRARRLRSQILPAVKAMDAARMITLTLKASPDPLREQLHRLGRCWRRLRQRKAAKSKLRGGLYVVEITYNARTGLWHPHLHIVADGAYWPQKDLSDLWRTITTDSQVVDIRAVHERSAVAAYVAKYVSKCHTPRDAPPAKLAEWCEAVHGMRMVQTFGHLHGHGWTSPPKLDHGRLQMVAPLGPLHAAAASGDAEAKHLLGLVHELTSHHPDDDDAPPAPAAFDADREVVAMLAAWWERRKSQEIGALPDESAPEPPPPIEPPPLLW